ncbi:MAG: glycogen synthase GlgA [Candidatus Sedimenticola sp. 20ELBAFRAG]
MSSPNATPLKILFASSEAQPLIKTGGLADVAGSLPTALTHFGHDVHLVLPAYPEAVENAVPLNNEATLQIPGFLTPVQILKGKIGERVTLYLVDAPGMFDRPGNPYVDANGNDWPDNPERFTLFSRVVAAIALNQTGFNWQPDIVHCNDWQTGLVPALLAGEWNRPATVFTIHNMAYQGVYDRETFDRLGLPEELWSYDGLEYHDNLSFLKGGIAFSDWVNTVSPSYAKEILTHEFGYGLEGLLSHRGERLAGVLNGIDYDLWNPASDPAIPQPFDASTFSLKKTNKLKLQQEMGLPADENALLFGHIGRLVSQKGVDLILDILPSLMHKENAQIVILGSGDPELERQVQIAAERHPEKTAVFIGYDEALAHRIEAGCDCFLMPSRFEPCGLNQLYSLRYGTVPIVHSTGGLADTVVDATPNNLLNGSATGFALDTPSSEALWECIERVFELRKRPAIWWEKLATTGMKQDFSWDASALHYQDIYRQAIDNPAPNPIA